MSDPAECAECEAILEDLRSAAGMPSRQQMLAAREITLKAILSTDEESIEQLLEKHPYRLQADDRARTPRYLQPQFQAVFRRLWDHRARTGHWPLPYR
jgi:hypothetical protein